MVKIYVQETSKGLKFPKSIAEERGHNTSVAILVVSIGLLIGAIYFNTFEWFRLLNWLSLMILILIVTELICRICAITEELKHFTSRYNDELSILMQDIFSFSSTSIMITIIAFITFMFTWITFQINIFNDYGSMILASISILLFSRFFGMEKSPLNESVQISKSKGLDYGCGMAHSFFHGYLRIILRHSGVRDDKGIRESMDNYEAKHNVKFECYKLFILVPLSQFCPPSLQNDFSPSVEVSSELEYKELDRAGVTKRNYKNSVYKIRTHGGLKYVPAEYATPIKTLQEVINYNSVCSNNYKKYRAEILLNFYLTLRDLLKKDPECCNLCEVIYYNDKDENGEFYDVGQIILSKMKELKKKTA